MRVSIIGAMQNLGQDQLSSNLTLILINMNVSYSPTNIIP